MRMLHKLYQRVLKLSRHRHAGFYLMALAFFEAFILPVSPGFLQVPMTFARPRKAWRYCVMAIIGSIVGAVIGYLIGDFFINLLIPVFKEWGWYGEYLNVKAWFQAWGLIVLFGLSLLPSPYKITTIASGAVGIPFYFFLPISGLARVIHFTVVAYVMSSSHTQRLKRWMMQRYGRKIQQR